MNTKFIATGPFCHIGKKAILPGLLVLLLMVVSIGVVFTKHSSRVMHAKLQAQNITRDNLNNEWNQLLLEQATWTSGLRVEKVANEQLQMITPTKVEIIKP